MYSEGCEYCFWGQRSSPTQTVQGLMALDNLFLPTLLSVQQRKRKIEKLLQSDE